MGVFGPYQKKTPVRVQNFEGGLNTKAEEIFLDLDQTPSGQNVTTGDLGAIGTAKGFKKLNTFLIASAAIDGVHSFVDESLTAQMIVACNGDIFRLSGTTFQTIPSAQGVFTAGKAMDFHTFENLLFMGNGTDRNYKWNNTEFTRMGVSAPTQTLAVSINSAGTLNSNYTWCYTSVNSFSVESDFTVLSTIEATNDDILVGSIATAPISHGVNQHFIYRNTAAVSGVYYRVTALSNGVTSFVDNNSDSTLVTAAPLNHDPPKNFKYMISFKGYLFAAGEPDNPNYLWFSTVNVPETFPNTNFFRIGRGDGQTISGIGIESDNLVISKSDGKGTKSTYTLYIGDSVGVTSADNWYLSKSSPSEGSESHRAMVNFSDVITLFNRDGCFAFAGGNLATTPADTGLGRLRVDALSFNIEPDFFAFKKSAIGNAAGILFENKLYFAVTSATASTENDKIYVFDFVRAKSGSRLSGSWIPLTGHSISDFTIHEDALYGGSSLADGFIYQLNTGTNYDGSAINSFFTTAPVAGKKGDEEHHKIFRFMYLLLDCSGSWNATFTPIFDFDQGSGSPKSISLSCAGSLWGTMVWGNDEWGVSTGRKRIRINLPPRASRYFQFKIATNTADEFWKMFSYELYYNKRGLRNG